VDATIVRLILLPATMELVGRFNWWLPGWLDRALPRVRLDEAGPATGPAPECSAVAESATGDEAERSTRVATV
jgi:putative drug exporter of the RND superfamily